MMAISISVRRYLIVLICVSFFFLIFICSGFCHTLKRNSHVSLIVSGDEPLFMCLSPCLLQKNVNWVFCPFSVGLFSFFVVVELMSCLYVLEIKSSLVASFANIFPQSICCIFVLFMASFVVQKLVSLIRAHLFIFAFISIILGD